MIQKFILWLFVIIIFQTSAWAQKKKADVTAPETQKEKKLETKLVRKLYSPHQFFHETSLFIKQPSKWKGSDWLKLSAITVSTVAIMPFDERIAVSSQGKQQFVMVADAGRIYGEWYSIAAVAGVFGVYGLVAHDTATKKISIELLQAGLYSELVTTVLKVAAGRARPLTEEGAFTYHPFTLVNYDYHSMPSGHTTSAFALSTIMSRHAKSTLLKILPYLPAGLTMFARVYENQHWLSDEVLGATIGFVVGNWVFDLHEGKKHRINVTSVSPLGISYTFK